MSIMLGKTSVKELHGPWADFMDKLQGDDGEDWFTAFKKFLRKENPWEKNILTIDRTSAFDPVAFMGNGWSIVEEDERSLKLTEVDLININFETMLKGHESSVVGEEKLKRLKDAGHLRLDAKMFQTLWKNQHLIPLSWKEPTNGENTFVFFDGTILQDTDGDRYILFLSWGNDGWYRRYEWLGEEWGADSPSAILAS